MESKNDRLLRLWKARQEAEGIDVSGVKTLEEAEHFYDKRDAGESAELPAAPEVPDMTDDSELPDALEVPDAPEVPVAPDVPEMDAEDGKE